MDNSIKYEKYIDYTKFYSITYIKPFCKLFKKKLMRLIQGYFHIKLFIHHNLLMILK